MFPLKTFILLNLDDGKQGAFSLCLLHWLIFLKKSVSTSTFKIKAVSFHFPFQNTDCFILQRYAALQKNQNPKNVMREKRL